MSGTLYPLPPGEVLRPGMARVFAIYDANLAEIQADIRERLASHPEFGPLIRDTPVDPEQEAANHRRLRAAMVDWRWDGYWDNTRAQAAGYATAEIPLASWVELVNLFRHDLLARVVAASEREHLLEDIQALDRWLDDAIAAFAQAFVSANEGVIEGQQRAIRQLSTPVLQLRPGLLILPIVGALDRDRLAQMRALVTEPISWLAATESISGTPVTSSTIARARRWRTACSSRARICSSRSRSSPPTIGRISRPGFSCKTGVESWRIARC